ncbi:type IV secretory system conjugative DNA transfer family protein [Methylorubrum rhodesianum]|uniref:type IV secretory system conjugative DNA transfer family protein n=1 Tax=Methylorubrum rhodesianum TaxID=29427 RepID=UPI003CFC5A49
MIRVLGSLILAGTVAYWTIGWATLRLLHDGLGWGFRSADRVALAAVLIATLLLWLGARRLLAHRSPQIDVFGSARFMTVARIRSLLVDKPNGLIVGREDRTRGRLLRYDGEAHFLTLAPTRSGKGVGAVIPNLLTAERSILCIDPKGENARVTTRARRRLGPVHVLDPFGVSGVPSAAYNPLDAVDATSPDAAEDAATLADALVSDPPGQVAEAHWNEEAKALLAGLILYVATEEEPYRRTLATVRELVTLAPEAFRDLLTRMQESSAVGGLVARAANRHLSKSEREASGVLSSAQRHTHFLDSPRMAQVMEGSGFAFADLKARTCTVFLVLPPDRLDTYGRWLRLMVAQAITAMARFPLRPPSPVLFLLDEFAALGRLEPVERAMGLMAGYGLQLWPILQDLHQLKSTYGERAGTFLANAGVTQVFNVNDVDTATWVSKALGDATTAYETQTTGTNRKALDWSGDGTTTSQGTSTHLTRRALLTPDEVRRLAPDRAILFLAGEAPVLARKVVYHRDAEFGGLFDTPAGSGAESRSAAGHMAAE